MSDTPEALAAILAEMREAARSGEHADGPLIEDCADRIEAAVKRERATGNAAAIRAALVEVEGAIFEDEPGRFWLADAEVILHKVQAALAAPARNCDVYQTAEEAYAAWQKHNSLTAICDWLFATAEGGDHA